MVREYWKKEKVPQKLAEHRRGAKKFYLLDGPPYVNASPHVGHVKATTCKDIWSRLRYMQGHDAHIQAGFDCHGLPVEVMVEKELGVQSKQDVEKMGIEKFDRLCLDKVENNEKIWLSVYESLGAWRGHFEPYFTYKPYYIESAWWTLKRLHEKGFLVEGNKSIHWCPHCETALSGYEVSDSYKDVTDPSVYVKFKVHGKDNEYLLVWTTTPWTLPSNVALAVAAEEEYVKAVVGSETFILAEKRAEPVLKTACNLPYRISEKFKGKTLDGLRYEPIYPCEQQKEASKNEKAYRIYLSIPLMSKKKYKKYETGAKHEEEFQQFVTTEDGTGVVHTAPGHGQTDNFFGKHYGLPALSPVDEKGLFTNEVSPLSGLYFKKADKAVTETLKKDHALLHASTLTHSYPLCWRCKTPLVFRVSRQWYLSIESIKEKMISANQSVHWMPEFGKEALNNWLADAQDWCISQQRFWGIPLPIWSCYDCGRKHVVGSVDELRKSAIQDPGKLDDLHRHSVDKVQLHCACGKTMERVKDIFNVWFDSSIAPWASLGYPFRNKELFDTMRKDALVDLVTESQDQIRGWFYVLLFSGMATFDLPAYKNVSMMGWVVDDKGIKMSKSVGNVVWAQDAVKALGADVMRLYYCWDIAPWDVQKFSNTSAKEVYKALNILWNSFIFYNAYKPDGFSPERPNAKALEDAWILSRLNTVTSEVLGHYEKFEFHHVGRKLVDFAVNDFSRWYIKLVRDRADRHDESGKECFNVLNHVLEQLCLLFAPITPFLTEYLWHQLGNKGSVHFKTYPDGQAYRNDDLEAQMSLCIAMTESVNAARKDAHLKLRAPVRQVLVTGGAGVEKAVMAFQSILLSTLNALQVVYTDKPPQGDFAKNTFKGGEVFVDLERDELLTNLGRFRELTRKIQAARKAAGLNVKDRIQLNLQTPDPSFEAFLKKHVKDVTTAVGALSLTLQKARLKNADKADDVDVSFEFAKAN